MQTESLFWFHAAAQVQQLPDIKVVFFFLLVFLSTSGESVESPETASAAGVSEAPPAVIPSQGDLLGDLLNLDLTPPTTTGPPPPANSGMQMGAMDLLGGGLDSLVGLVHTTERLV